MIYSCMAIIHSKGKDHPGKVANPARGQLNRENYFSPCPRSRLRIWSRETGSAVPSRVSLLISILRLNLVLTCGIYPEFRGGVHLFVCFGFIYTEGFGSLQQERLVSRLYLVLNCSFPQFFFCLFCDSAWRRCPLLATFLSVSFCLLSLLFSERIPGLILVWFRLSCDHGWIRSGSVNCEINSNHNILASSIASLTYSHPPFPYHLCRLLALSKKTHVCAEGGG